MVVWEDWIAAESISGLEDLRLASKQRARRWATQVYLCVNEYSYFKYKYCIINRKKYKLYNKTDTKATYKSNVLIAYPFTFGIVFIFSPPLLCWEFLWILLISEVMLKWLILELLWKVFTVAPMVYDSIRRVTKYLFPVLSSDTH